MVIAILRSGSFYKKSTGPLLPNCWTLIQELYFCQPLSQNVRFLLLHLDKHYIAKMFWQHSWKYRRYLQTIQMTAEKEWSMWPAWLMHHPWCPDILITISGPLSHRTEIEARLPQRTGDVLTWHSSAKSSCATSKFDFPPLPTSWAGVNIVTAWIKDNYSIHISDHLYWNGNLTHRLINHYIPGEQYQPVLWSQAPPVANLSCIVQQEFLTFAP